MVMEAMVRWSWGNGHGSNGQLVLGQWSWKQWSVGPGAMGHGSNGRLVLGQWSWKQWSVDPGAMVMEAMVSWSWGNGHGSNGQLVLGQWVMETMVSWAYTEAEWPLTALWCLGVVRTYLWSQDMMRLILFLAVYPQTSRPVTDHNDPTTVQSVRQGGTDVNMASCLLQVHSTGKAPPGRHWVYGDGRTTSLIHGLRHASPGSNQAEPLRDQSPGGKYVHVMVQVPPG